MAITFSYEQTLANIRKRQAVLDLLNEVATCERCKLERLHGIARNCSEHYAVRFDIAAIKGRLI